MFKIQLIKIYLIVQKEMKERKKKKDLQYHQMSAFKPHQLWRCVWFWVGLDWVSWWELRCKKKPKGKSQDALTQLLQSLSWAWTMQFKKTAATGLQQGSCSRISPGTRCRIECFSPCNRRKRLWPCCCHCGKGVGKQKEGVPGLVLLGTELFGGSCSPVLKTCGRK